MWYFLLHVSSYIITYSMPFLPSFQQIALVLNASRRFRYTLDLARDEERENLRRVIRAHAQVIRVSDVASAS